MDFNKKFLLACNLYCGTTLGKFLPQFLHDVLLLLYYVVLEVKEVK